MKKMENLQNKLEIKFAPKIVASNEHFQPIYEMIILILKLTDFWQDLERAFDESISEAERKIREYVEDVINYSQQNTNPKNLNNSSWTNKSFFGAKRETSKNFQTSGKKDGETKSMKSGATPKTTKAIKKIQTDLKKITEISKSSSQNKKPNHANETKASETFDSKKDLQSMSLSSNTSWTSDFFLSQVFQNRVIPAIDVQIIRKESDFLKNPEKKSFIHSENKFLKPNIRLERTTRQSNLHSIVGETVIAEVIEEDFGEKNGFKSESSFQPEKFLINQDGFNRSYGQNIPNRYSRRSRRQTESNQENKNEKNPFKKNSLDEEGTASNNKSENHSSESSTSEKNDRKIEFLKNNNVRRESLSKVAGIVFSFGKIPSKNTNLSENVSGFSQISNFE